MRNRPELTLLASIAYEYSLNSPLNIAVLGCSNGAEVYSILWKIRKSYPSLNVRVHAMDISEDVLKIAKKGTIHSKIQNW